MTRKKAITIVLVIIAFFALIGVGVFLFGNKPSTDGTTNSTASSGISFRDFLPWGNSNDNTPTTPTNNDQTDGNNIPTTPSSGTSILRKVSDRSVVAGTTVETSLSVPGVNGGPDEITLAKAVRYIERSTGNVFEIPLAGGEEKRISSTRIPEIYEGSFADKGQSVVFRYLKEDNTTIETFTGKLPNAEVGEAGDIKGSFLPENITSLSLSPDSTKVFYLTNFGAGVIGTTAMINGDKKADVWKHSFTEWLTQWPSGKAITVTTKPSSGVAGFLYSLNSTTGLYTKVLGNVPGLTTLMSPDERYVLYSSSSGANLSLNILDQQSKTTNELSVKTLPEKCIWSKGNFSFYCAVPVALAPASYPDAWYQGRISFNDEIVKIGVDGKVNTLGNLSLLSGKEIDATNLFLDQDESTLFFTNKKDSVLWSLDLVSSQSTN